MGSNRKKEKQLQQLAGYCLHSGYQKGLEDYSGHIFYKYLDEACLEREPPFDPAHFGEDFTQQTEQGPTM